MRDQEILRVEGLTVVRRDDPGIRIVDDVSFSVMRGEALGLAGESGCGKTTTALAVLGLLPQTLRRSRGELTFNSLNGPQPLHRLEAPAMRKIRWASISMIFQGAMNALDPVKRIGDQIAEAILLHEPKLGRSTANRQVADLLEQVGVPARRARQYPHEFSGGQKQRVMIALALACEPDLVIGDEPTTALDVINQAQILDLLNELRRERGLALLLITHDLAVLSQTCDRVAVMYAGEIVESGSVAEVFDQPQHPYTQRLLSLFTADDEPGRLPEPIPGSQPRPGSWPAGCHFRDRCELATAQCEAEHPALRVFDGGRASRCLLSPAPAPTVDEATQ